MFSLLALLCFVGFFKIIFIIFSFILWISLFYFVTGF